MSQNNCRNSALSRSAALAASVMLAAPLAVMQVAHAGAAAVQAADPAAVTSNSPNDPPGLETVHITANLERAVSTVDEQTVKHASPSSNVLQVLTTVPGFNVLTQGPANLSAGDNIFTLDGFSSNEVGTTYYGVPQINLGRGGFFGQGDDHAITPLTLGEVGGVKVYSGSNTPSENSIDSLGGTIEFLPKMPLKIFQAGVEADYSSYDGGGDVNTEGFSIDSGDLAGLNGLRVHAAFHHIVEKNFVQNIRGTVNATYLSLVQPFDSNQSQLSLIVSNNTESGNPPDKVPQPLLDRFGHNWFWPTNIYAEWEKTRATNVILGLKSLVNNYTLADVKVFVSDNRNDRTAHADPSTGSFYLGFRIPETLKSCGALDGYGSNYDTYDAAAAQSQFGSCSAGSAYQRYVDDYKGVGGRADFTLLLPYNTVGFGALIDDFHDTSREFWYGSAPVPTVIGLDNAWYEEDTVEYLDGYVQDDVALLNKRLHFYPGVKLVHTHVGAMDAQGYYYGYGGQAGKSYAFTEPSIGARYDFARDWEAYVNWGRSEKAPNVSAFYSLIGSQPTPLPVTVRPEYVNSIDAGIRYAGDWGKVSAAVFNRQFQDIFSYHYDSSTGITNEYNAGSARYRGFTLRFDKSFDDGLGVHATYGLTHAVYTKGFTGDNGTVTSGQWRTDVPKYTANLGVDWTMGPAYVRLTDHLVGSQYLAYESGETSPRQLGSYGVLNVLGSYDWQPEGEAYGVKVELFIDNLLNKNYNVAANIHGAASDYANYDNTGKPYTGAELYPFQQSAVGAPRTIGLRVRLLLK